MKIVVLSTDVEHYLLQWWFPHSAKKFDFGVIVDFNWEDNPKDNTYELYKKFVPHWRYIKIKQKDVNVFLWDVILSKIETDLRKEFPESWVTTLNATEFLIGDMSFLDKVQTKRQILVPCHLMNDLVEEENIEPNPDIPLIEQRHHGVHYKSDYPHPHRGKSFNLHKEQNPEGVILNTRWMRSIHNYDVDYLSTSIYSVGRHYWDLTRVTEHLAICHMNFSPYTSAFFARKMNVQRRLSQADHQAQRGFHHVVDEAKIKIRKKFYDQLTVDLLPEIQKLENSK